MSAHDCKQLQWNCQLNWQEKELNWRAYTTDIEMRGNNGCTTPNKTSLQWLCKFTALGTSPKHLLVSFLGQLQNRQPTKSVQCYNSRDDDSIGMQHDVLKELKRDTPPPVRCWRDQIFLFSISQRPLLLHPFLFSGTNDTFLHDTRVLTLTLKEPEHPAEHLQHSQTSCYYRRARTLRSQASGVRTGTPGRFLNPLDYWSPPQCHHYIQLSSLLGLY